MARILIIIYFVSSTSILLAQSDFRPGYFINPKGDTISGLIQYKENKSQFYSVKYKPSEEKAIDLDPYGATAYGFTGGRQFVSREVSTESGKSRVYLRTLIRGKATLYRFLDRYFAHVEEHEFSELKNTKKIIVVDDRRMNKDSREYIGLLTVYFGDCNNVLSNLNTLSLTEKELINIFKEYNTCVGSENISYEEGKAWSEWNFGLHAGSSYSRLAFNPNDNPPDHLTKNLTNTSVIGGVDVYFKTPRFSERFSFRSGLQFIKTNYEKQHTTTFFSSTRNHDVSISITQLKFPLGLMYDFPGRMYMGFNLTFTKHLSTSSNYILEVDDGNSITTSESTALDIRGDQLGVSLDLGATLSFGNLPGYLQVSLERTDGIDTKAIFHYSNVTRVNLLLGIKL